MPLQPKEERFFDLFVQAAGLAAEAARGLLDILSDFSDVTRRVAQLRSLEHDADAVLVEVVTRLNTSLVTPIDREDILALASGLDDVMDAIEAAADRLDLFRVSAPLPEALPIVRILVQAADELQEALGGFSNFRQAEPLTSHFQKVKDLETEGDTAVRAAIGNLFDGTLPALEVMKWREIYEHLEMAIDHCEDVANTLEAVVVKNG